MRTTMRVAASVHNTFCDCAHCCRAACWTGRCAYGKTSATTKENRPTCESVGRENSTTLRRYVSDSVEPTSQPLAEIGREPHARIDSIEHHGLHQNTGHEELQVLARRASEGATEHESAEQRIRVNRRPRRYRPRDTLTLTSTLRGLPGS